MLNTLPVNMMAIAMGLHVRCGIEDNLWTQDRKAKMSSVKQVEQLVRISREFGREIATGKEARRICRIGEFYDSIDETLAKNGFAPNRQPAPAASALQRVGVIAMTSPPSSSSRACATTSPSTGRRCCRRACPVALRAAPGQGEPAPRRLGRGARPRHRRGRGPRRAGGPQRRRDDGGALGAGASAPVRGALLATPADIEVAAAGAAIPTTRGAGAEWLAARSRASRCRSAASWRPAPTIRSRAFERVEHLRADWGSDARQRRRRGPPQSGVRDSASGRRRASCCARLGVEVAATPATRLGAIPWP